MKRLKIILLGVAITGSLVSCVSGEKKKSKEAEEVIDKANELMEATGDYVVSEITDFEERLEKYQKKTKDRLTRVDEWVDDLTEEGRKKYDEKVNQLEKQQKELNKKIKSYKRAGKDKKKELRKEIEDLNDAIRKGYEAFEEEVKEGKR